MKGNCLRAAQEMEQEIVRHRRTLHRCAETGFDVPETTAYIDDVLKGYGYQPKRLKKGGIVAEISPKEADRDGFILLRADIDGLKMKEESGVEFASENGNMHACGHDMHAAALLGAAKLLRERQEKLSVSVRLLFQPAEEILQGARYALDAGVADGVRAAFSLHVLAGLDVSVGKILFSGAGEVAPSSDYFQVAVKGKSCHGGAPHGGVDALLTAADILLRLQTVIAREVPCGKGVLTVGTLQGGDSPNAIAGECKFQGTLRAYDEQTRTFMKKRLKEIAGLTARSYRAAARVSFSGGCPSLYQDKNVLRATREAFEKEFGTSQIVSAEQGGVMRGGSEDFAYISRAVPSVTVSVSAAEGGVPLHNPRLVLDEQALCVCTAAYLTFALAGIGK